MKLLSLLLTLLVTAEAFGQTATIVIPQPIIAGELTRFDAKYDGDSISWSIYPPTKYSDALDRQTLVPFAEFVPKSGVEYMVTLWAFKNVDGKALNAKQEYVFRASPTPPVPPVPPNPPNPPVPPNPDLQGLALKTYQWAKAVGNKTETKQIAENYAAINSAIAAGAYKNLPGWTEQRAKVIGDLYEKNRPITQNNEEWGIFFKNLSQELKELDNGGHLNGLPSLHGILQSIQQGLEAVQ
jgi:hypothetical protein